MSRGSAHKNIMEKLEQAGGKPEKVVDEVGAILEGRVIDTTAKYEELLRKIDVNVREIEETEKELKRRFINQCDERPPISRRNSI